MKNKTKQKQEITNKINYKITRKKKKKREKFPICFCFSAFQHVFFFITQRKKKKIIITTPTQDEEASLNPQIRSSSSISVWLQKKEKTFVFHDLPNNNERTNELTAKKKKRGKFICRCAEKEHRRRKSKNIKIKLSRVHHIQMNGSFSFKRRRRFSHQSKKASSFFFFCAADLRPHF